MDKYNEMKSSVKNKGSDIAQSAYEGAEALTDQVREAAADLYKEGKRKITQMEGCVEDCSEELLKKVHRKPLTSLLIAGGIGFILSRLFPK